MLNLHRLALLRELDQRGTLSEVARVLSYSPSAVSQQLATLETEVGVPLVIQVGRRLRLTRQGSLLVEHANRILGAVERAESEVRGSAWSGVGTVRIACFQTAALALIPDVLVDLRHTDPDLRLEVTEIAPDGILEGLLTHDFDLVVGEEYPGLPIPRHKAVEFTELARDQLRLAVSGAMPRRAVNKDVLASMSERDWVMEPGGNAARAWAVGMCRDAGFEPTVAFESADLLVHVRLVETGHAVALLPGLVWANREVRLKPVELPNRPVRRIFAAVRRGAAVDPGIVAVRAGLIAAAGRSMSSARTAG